VTPDDFLRLACLDYERWHRSDAEKARVSHRGLALAAVRRLLAE